MDDVSIGPMEIHHIPQVLAIERTLFTTPWSDLVFLQELQRIDVSRAFVAIKDDTVVGYMVAWFIDEEIHLLNIAVARDMHQKGIGSQLLSHLIDVAVAEARKLITLEVRSSNIGAQALYRSFFFESMGLRKKYYSDNSEDALLMLLDVEKYYLQKRKDKWKE
jgi:ribosomal-protein-alanine N-acetyltransferase